MAMKNKDKVLLILQEKNIPVERGELVKQTGFDNANMGTYLTRLTKDGYVKKADYGIYIITDEGKLKADEIRNMYGEQSSLFKKENEFTDKSTGVTKDEAIKKAMFLRETFSNDKEFRRTLGTIISTE